MALMIGRLMAVAAHPVLAWRCLHSPGRAVLAFGYGAAAYLTTLIALFAFKGTAGG